MKLVVFAVLATLGLGNVAHADPAARNGQLKQALLERFDRNHDGKLDAEERHRAARALRRIANRLERSESGGNERHDRHPRGAGTPGIQGTPGTQGAPDATTPDR